MPQGDHFYTTSAAERDNAVSSFFYVSEGTACFVYPESGAGRTDFFRLVNGANGDHFYTTWAAERDNAIISFGYASEGTACWVHPAPAAGTVPLLRLRSNSTGDHFYTTNATEAAHAVAQLNYVSEGTACHVFPASTAATVPLFRLFKPGDRHVDVNIILVGSDGFTTANRTQVDSSIAIMRSIYEKVGLGVRVAGRFAIPLAQANGHESIENGGEASSLTSEWTVPNTAVDVFVVKVMTDADGRSPVNGPCDKNAKGMTGSVVSLNGSTANSGNTFAHEVGHYLGLDHIPDTGNFIGGGGASNSFTGIFGWQGDIMKRHCFVHPD
jgi:Repeat of unknown function (DUF5648)/Metallo-peptidase family M12B Reprolysin-like